MKPDVLSQDFRIFKRKSEAAMPGMTKEEMRRVKKALEILVWSFEQRLRPPSARARKTP